MTVSPREILASGAAEMGISLNDSQLDQFDSLTELLLDWNSRVNLTRITDRTEIVVKHYLDSLALLRYINPAEGASVIDVGTGPGIPGLPLKIMRPDIRLALLDSVRKKLSFAEAAANALNLTNVSVIHARAEDAGHDSLHREKYDLVISRAVARLAILSELCLPLCKVGGRFVAYKGPDIDEEVEEIDKAAAVLGGKVAVVEKFSLPNSDLHRSLAIIEKIRKTPAAYPRKAGVPSREPLIRK